MLTRSMPINFLQPRAGRADRAAPRRWKTTFIDVIGLVLVGALLTMMAVLGFLGLTLFTVYITLAIAVEVVAEKIHHARRR